MDSDAQGLGSGTIRRVPPAMTVYLPPYVDTYAGQVSVWGVGG